MMNTGKRHVLTLDKPHAVKSVLEEFSAGAQTNGNVRREIRRGLEEFAKHGGVRLILDLHVVGPSFKGSPSTVRNISAFLAGEVLVVTGQVTSRLMLRILQARAESRRRFFPERLKRSMRVFISNAVVEMEMAVHLIAYPIRRTRGVLARAR
jgi:hypothetical protein